MNDVDSEIGWDKALRPPYVTYLLCGLCALMFFWQMKEGGQGAQVGYPGYVDGTSLFQGQYWGLLSSFFLHGNIAHVGFNVYWLYLFGRAVEPYIGWRWYLLFWAVATALSSMVEVDFTGTTGIGASGFGYALFGFIWIGGRKHPYLARALDRQTVVLFIIWLFVCVGLTWTGTEAIGNAAHFSGFLFGGLCAYAFLERTEAEWKWAVAAITLLSFFPLFYAPWLGTWNMVQAMKAYDQGRYDRVLSYLDRTHLPEQEAYLIQLRGDTLSQLNRDDEAAAVYKSLLSLHSEAELSDPGYLYNEYAWILATSPNAKVRNPTDAIHYAQLACDKDDENSDYLDTLAAAYASANQFDQAVTWEQKAIDANSDPKAIDEFKAHLKLFQAQKPYLESAKSAGGGT